MTQAMTSERASRRGLLTWLAGAEVLLMLVVLWIASWSSSTKCDDSCLATKGEGVPDGVRWQDTVDAWQWDGQVYVGTFAVGAAILGFALALVGLKSASKLSLASAVLAWVLWAAFV